MCDEDRTFVMTGVGDEHATAVQVEFTLPGGHIVSGVGSSKRHPKDKDDANTAVALAAGRAFAVLSERLANYAGARVAMADISGAMSREEKQ